MLALWGGTAASSKLGSGCLLPMDELETEFVGYYRYAYVGTTSTAEAADPTRNVLLVLDCVVECERKRPS